MSHRRTWRGCDWCSLIFPVKHFKEGKHDTGTGTSSASTAQFDDSCTTAVGYIVCFLFIPLKTGSYHAISRTCRERMILVFVCVVQALT